MGYRTIQQQISATNQFDGTAPAGNATRANDMEAFAEQDAGGLFDFGQTQPTPLKHFTLKGGGQASWKLELVDADGDAYPILEGTNEATVFEKLDSIIMLSGQKLKLTTVGATTAMKARVTASTR